MVNREKCLLRLPIIAMLGMSLSLPTTSSMDTLWAVQLAASPFEPVNLALGNSKCVQLWPTDHVQAMWLRFAPSLKAVDPDSWGMHKLGGLISPLEVMLNGSQAQHAVGLEGVRVLSRDHSQQLRIRCGSGCFLSSLLCLDVCRWGKSMAANLKMRMA